MLFVIMSGRKKKDYRAVFQALTEILPVSPVVSRITVDFERAVWTVLRQVFPMTTIQRLFLPLDSSSMEKGIVFISSFCFHKVFKFEGNFSIINYRDCTKRNMKKEENLRSFVGKSDTSCIFNIIQLIVIDLKMFSNL